MKITIHAVDYTSALDASRPLSIERRLNDPALCAFLLTLPEDGSLAVPARMQYVIVSGDDGSVYFTGYVAVPAVPEYLGRAAMGPRYRYLIQALSDECLLDQQLQPSSSLATQQKINALLQTLVTRSGVSAISASSLTLGTVANNVLAEPGAKWSQRAGQIATQARAAYRVVNSTLALSDVGGTVHSLQESTGTLSPSHLAFSTATTRALANDVTVCGRHEPTAYITEYYQGDGTTTEFALSADPFALSSADSVLIEELFQSATLNSRNWSVVASSGYLSLGTGGLVMNGGNGYDGQTLLSWLEPIELSGTLLMEASGVVLQSGSSGILNGIYAGDLTQEGCICGFLVTTQSSAVVVQPFVSGAAVGTSQTISSSDQYTLRIRLHAAEMERAQSFYHAFGDSGEITSGGAVNALNARVQMEVQPYVDGVAGTPVTLFDGAISDLIYTGLVVPVSSLSLVGSMRSFRLRSLGSAWVTSTPSGGSSYTRRMGTTSESAECHVERTGRLVFYSGYIPPSGEQIVVFYRGIGRAVGRAVNSTSQAALAAAGSPSVAAWIGTVHAPATRSSADCRNAAAVMVAAASGTAALWAGTYRALRSEFASDVWPGAALELVAASLGLDVQVVVRTVQIRCRATRPESVEYEIAFANDWADDLAIHTSSSVPADALLPVAISPSYLSNLNALTVTSVSGSAVVIDAGVAPPTGGGFEVRRRDNCFQAGNDSDLVLRATTQAFTFARQSSTDRFYIRMYDASTPPLYSEFSAAVFINLPLGS